MDESDLTQLFARLGARNPASWAHSQVSEHIPQLARFLFLRQAWRHVVSPDDETWVSEQLKTAESMPGGAIAPALRRLLVGGASIVDLTAVVRVMQWILLFDLCQLLDDPGHIEEEVKNIN